jgi:hypothetical protein
MCFGALEVHCMQKNCGEISYIDVEIGALDYFLANCATKKAAQTLTAMPPPPTPLVLHIHSED